MHNINIPENFSLPRWNDLPEDDIYVEQVLSLIGDCLNPYLSTDGKAVMTKTMINNYVKNKYIPAPTNKKYDRTTVASLFVIAILKYVFTIEEVSTMIDLSIVLNGSEISYDEFCSMIENAVKNAFHGTSMNKERDPSDPRYICWSVCNAFACQLYVRHLIHSN